MLALVKAMVQVWISYSARALSAAPSTREKIARRCLVVDAIDCGVLLTDRFVHVVTLPGWVSSKIVNHVCPFTLRCSAVRSLGHFPLFLHFCPVTVTVCMPVRSENAQATTARSACQTSFFSHAPSCIPIAASPDSASCLTQ